MKSIPAVLHNAINSFDGAAAGSDDNFGETLRNLRKALGLSQEGFAYTYGIPVGNVQNWEQAGRGNRPDSAARQLIEMIAEDPEGVADIVKRVRQRRALVRHGIAAISPIVRQLKGAR